MDGLAPFGPSTRTFAYGPARYDGPMRRHTLILKAVPLLSLTALLTASACGGTTAVIPPTAAPAVSVVVTPLDREIGVGGSVEIGIGRTVTLAAQVTGGDANTARTVSWSVVSSNVVTVTPSGNTARVEGIRPGVVIVDAIAATGASGHATVRVRGVPYDLDCVVAPHSGLAPLAVDFTARVTGCYHACVVTWDFGDGQRAEDRDATHVYGKPGSYKAIGTLDDRPPSIPSKRECIRKIEVRGGQ
jgi:PKD domain-containing protein